MVSKIGIYGGTFDPIHNGHLRVVVELLSRKIVDSIILIPAGQPRLRSEEPVADGKARLEMCKLAVQDLPTGIRDQVSVSDIEINREGPTYAFDTVSELSKNGAELFWVIGSDAYANVDQWHRASELKELVNFIVIDRPGADDENAFDIDALDISATQVRQDRELHGVTPSVRKFILERKLYASK